MDNKLTLEDLENLSSPDMNIQLCHLILDPSLRSPIINTKSIDEKISLGDQKIVGILLEFLKNASDDNFSRASAYKDKLIDGNYKNFEGFILSLQILNSIPSEAGPCFLWNDYFEDIEIRYYSTSKDDVGVIIENGVIEAFDGDSTTIYDTVEKFIADNMMDYKIS